MEINYYQHEYFFKLSYVIIVDDYTCNSSSRAENNNLKNEISKKLNETLIIVATSTQKLTHL